MTIVNAPGKFSVAAHPSRRRLRIAILLAITGIGVFTSFALPPLRQSDAYHRFVDSRPLFGIPNFLDVISNAAFPLAAMMGLHVLFREGARGAAFRRASERWPYAAFFCGIALTGIGSTVYHLAPADSTLVWDRLPMTLAFMSLLAAVIAERIDVKAGLWLLAPLIVSGACSVVYWQQSGNLWPYAVVQYLSIVLILLMMMLFPSPYTRSADLFAVAGIYGVAKVAEVLDASIYALTTIVSGHTLKHLIAALAAYKVVRMLARRTHRLQVRQAHAS